MPLTQMLVKSKEFGWAIPSFIIEVALAGDEAKKGNDYWCCGKCSSAIALRVGVVPKVCSKCGSEIDWVGIKTRLIKVCPTCNAQGEFGDSYCSLHTPAVRLVAKEIPL